MKHGLFVTFDDGYFQYFKSLITSIRIQYPNYPTIYIAYKGSNNEIGNYIRQIPKAEPVIYRTDYGKLTYQRFRLWNPDELQDVDKIIHLDCDMIVREPLDELFEHEEFYIVSNAEPHYSVRIFNKDSSQHLIRSALRTKHMTFPDGPHSMANAGMFMIPRKYRTEMYIETLIKLDVELREFFGYNDQSAISLWCRYFNIPIRREIKDLEYNVQPPQFSIPGNRVKLENAKIIHYSGLTKPHMPEFDDWNWVPTRERIELKEIYETYSGDNAL